MNINTAALAIREGLTGPALADFYLRVIRIEMGREHAHKSPADRLAIETNMLRQSLRSVCDLLAVVVEPCEDPIPTLDDLDSFAAECAQDWKNEARKEARHV